MTATTITIERIVTVVHVVVSLKVELRADAQQPAAENLRHVRPGRAVLRVHVQHVAGVEHVIDVEVAAQAP